MNYEILPNWLLTHGVKIAAIIVGGGLIYWIIAHWGQKALAALLAKTAVAGRSPDGKKKRIKTLNEVLTKTVGIVLFLIVILMVLIELGINITPILAGAGVAGIAVGFGAQSLVKDFFHGLFILLEDQYAEGDIISTGNISGIVEDFDLRRTILRDLDGIQYHIPNGEITIVGNKTRAWSGINLNVGVDYSTNLSQLKRIVNEIGQSIKNDFKEDVLEAPTLAGVEDFADSAIVVKILGKVQPGKQWNLTRELRKRLKEAFDQEGIEIPFPHRVEIHKKEE